MNHTTTIRVKAFLLLSVFSLNTVVGAACCARMNTLPQDGHHEKKSEQKPHAHDHGNAVTQGHHSAPVAKSAHSHTDGGTHEHKKASQTVSHHAVNKTQANEEDNCCKENLLKYQLLDKQLSQSSKTELSAPVLLAFLSSFSGIDLFQSSVAPQLHTSILRYLFPPPPDIRTSIHRFQI